ncbi:MAG TPA: ZIP family metal transporter [Candidatus Thermoplasmatota archaeon]|nr:ZIP family metal transporter [Candidatus Thermoplasmatota archaeon]
MDAWAATLLAVTLVSLVSLVGALTLTLPGLRSHRTLLVLVAVAAGTLMGDAFFHLLPEAAESWAESGLDTMGFWILAGFILFFGLEVALRSRHAHAELATDGPGDAHAILAPHPAHGGHGPHHGDHGPAHHHGQQAIAAFAWTNLVGDALHNLLDGAVIAAAFLVDTGVGVATTIAVVVHEVPQELGDFAVLLRSGMTPRRALLFNLLSALCAVVGAVLILALPLQPGSLETFGLPLIAGAFVYIAAADLVPELHHHSKGRAAFTILGAFLVGVAIMYGLLRLEQSGLLGTG